MPHLMLRTWRQIIRRIRLCVVGVRGRNELKMKIFPFGQIEDCEKETKGSCSLVHTMKSQNDVYLFCEFQLHMCRCL